MKDIMRPVKLVNKEILEILNGFKDLWWEDRENLHNYYNAAMRPEKWDKNDREEWVGEKYLEQIKNMGNAHDGYPVQIKCFDLQSKSTLNHPSHNFELANRWDELNQKLQIAIGTKQNVLCAVYPPGGYISWHNNANAPSYNIILTWSENGDGWWKHVDPYTGEIVTVPDVPGWQAKGFYFGSYEDGSENIVYHAASTDCWRMTIAYIFDMHHKEFWEEALEELEME